MINKLIGIVDDMIFILNITDLCKKK
jgi:hypothetical protein